MPDGLQVLSRMTDAIAHRGPDDQGHWSDPAQGIFLGQRRLSILDLSAAGHQPMASHCGRYQLVYNGEIYNHLELRTALESAGHKPAWRGHSDTETLLAAITAWGFEATLGKLNGMFAIAAWDTRERALLLARDRLGEKPLYYGRLGDVWVFASELHALRKHPLWRGDIDRNALAAYLRHACVPAPQCIHPGLRKLEPGHWNKIDSVGSEFQDSRSYWQLDAIASNGVRHSAGASLRDCKQELEGRLTHAVKTRMLSDVPVGAFLSGGYDSSLVVSLMQRLSAQRVKTFTIGFSEPAYNEAPYAQAVARHLDTDHTELYVTPEDAMAVIPELPTIWDEPFADASQIPTYLVAKLASGSVKVALSGDGGDELFYGYSRFENTRRLWNKIAACPLNVRRVLATLGRQGAMPMADLISRFGGGHGALAYRLLARTAEAATVLDSDSSDEFYRRLIANHKTLPLAFTPSSRRPDTGDMCAGLEPFENRMLLADMQGYLPDTILTKVDRASMAVGMESRAPFLDHLLVEYAWTIPLEFKQRDGKGKWLLRQLVHEHVPASLVDRPKMGFGVPIGPWLRGPLLDWAESLLEPHRMEQQGLLDAAAVQMWRAHKLGLADWQYQLWTILMFQAWLESVQ